MSTDLFVLRIRPFHVHSDGKSPHPDDLPRDQLLLYTDQGMGDSTLNTLYDLVYLDIEQFDNTHTLTLQQELQRLNQQMIAEDRELILIGPGRWGTRMPELGVPVTFSEIKNVSVLCEIAKMHEGLNPDLSLGTHFFNDLVDMSILYMGISPERKGTVLNKDWLRQAPNRFSELLPSNPTYAGVIYVIDTEQICADCAVLLHADTLEQRGIVFLSSSAG